MNWNCTFTDLIRAGRAAYWGNWALDPKLAVGAVGIVSPDTGDFTLVKESLPGMATSERSVSNQWKLASSNVRRTKANVNLDGSGTDPESGTKGSAGLEVTWEFASAGSVASEFGIAYERYISDLTLLSKSSTLDWLAQQAASVSMGSDGSISQGFGVVTSVIYANSGLNLGSQDNNSSFSITGEVSAVQDMLAGANAKGSYVSTKESKQVDQHLWPSTPNKEADGAVPIAYTFASYDGTLLIPNWINRLGSLQILFNNKPGCTYITHIDLSYDTPHGKKSESFKLSGGISRTVGDIPLNATNITAKVTFKGVSNDDKYHFSWPSPLGQWLTGQREIEMTGVWPGQTDAREVGVNP